MRRGRSRRPSRGPSRGPSRRLGGGHCCADTLEPYRWAPRRGPAVRRAGAAPPATRPDHPLRADPASWHTAPVTTSTPLYDGLLGEALQRARAGDAAAARAGEVSLLHTAGPTGLCLGCGLTAPCPTTDLLAGASTLGAARAGAEQALLARVRATRPDGAEAGAEAGADPDAPVRDLPVMPSAAELFAPNPAFGRALSLLLGGA